MHGGTKVADKEFVVLTELLMVQLLKLDSIEAEGEAKVQRRIEVSCNWSSRIEVAKSFYISSFTSLSCFSGYLWG